MYVYRILYDHCFFRGCHIQNCSYRTDNSSSTKGYESEYENVAGMSAVTSPRKQTALQQPVTGNHRKMFVYNTVNCKFINLLLFFMTGMNVACHLLGPVTVLVMVLWVAISLIQHP